MLWTLLELALPFVDVGGLNFDVPDLTDIVLSQYLIDYVRNSITFESARFLPDHLRESEVDLL